MHDAIAAERLGIPAAGVITDRFIPTARAMAEFVGLRDYPVTVVAHPISNNTDAEIRAKAEQIVRQAIPFLLSPLRAR